VQKPSILNLLLSCFLLCFIHFEAQANNNISDRLISTQQAFDTFQLNTDNILKQAHKLNQQHVTHIDSLNQILSDTESSEAVLQSDLISKLELDASQMLILANQYVPHYQDFINSISRESSCYQPQQVSQFRQTITELEQYVDNIQSLAAAQGEAEAFAALMEININQARVSMVVNLFEMFKLCYITEAIGPLSQNFTSLSTILAQEVSRRGYVDDSDNYAKKSSKNSNEYRAYSNDMERDVDTQSLEKHRDSITQTYQFKLDTPPHFNELVYVHIGNIEQLNNLKLSNGLMINDDLSLRLPSTALADTSKAYQANITGVIETDVDIVTLDISLERIATTLITEMNFTDSDIERCVTDAVSTGQITHSHQLIQLNCDFSHTASNTGTTQLDDLRHFKQLNLISIKGGTLDSLAPLAALSSLDTLYLSQLTVNQFDDLRHFHGALNFTDVISGDWANLASTTAESISIHNHKNCKALQPLSSASHVAVMYKGLGPNELVAVMSQVDNGEKSLMVMTDCSKGQVNSL